MAEQKNGRWHIDTTVTLGTLIAVAMSCINLAALFVAGGRFLERIDQNTAGLRRVEAQQISDRLRFDQFIEMRTDVRHLLAAVERLESRRDTGAN